MTDKDPPQPPALTIDWTKIDEGLTDPQKEALRLIAAGLGNTEASRSIGMDRSAVSKWLKTSLNFLNAYERVKAEIRRYNEAMLEWVTTKAWIRLYQYLTFDPAELIRDESVPVSIKRALISEQAKILRGVTSGLRPHNLMVVHDTTPAMLKATENAANILAERLAAIEEQKAPPTIEAQVKEYRAVAAGAKPQDVDGILVDWTHQKLQCPACKLWYKDLIRHFGRDHGLSLSDARAKFGLENAPLTLEQALRRAMPTDE